MSRYTRIDTDGKRAGDKDITHINVRRWAGWKKVFNKQDFRVRRAIIYYPAMAYNAIDFLPSRKLKYLIIQMISNGLGRLVGKAFIAQKH